MADHFVNVESFWTPWEHQVCSQCHGSNPYAIWLVKVGCFQPHRHLQCDYIRVVIDSENTVLEPLRPMSRNFRSFHGAYRMCDNLVKGICPKRTCYFAHSDFEVDMWNVKKRLARGNKLVSQLTDLLLKSQCPSEVCQACFEANTKASWLSWVKCTNTDLHRDMNKITVVVSDKQLVKVRPLPPRVIYFSQVKMCARSQRAYRNDICRSSSCQCAHSTSELLYWQWQVARKMIFKKDIFFKELNTVYSYPDEHSEVINSIITQQLTLDNYYSKYHNLVYLEEMESSRKMIAECDSRDVVLRLEWSIEQPKFHVYLMNLTHTSMDYASHHNAEATVTLAAGQQYTAQVLGTPDYDRNALILQIPPQSALFQLCSPPDRLVYDFKASVHFEISHQYYLRLHKGIDFVIDETLRKLIPMCPERLCHSRFPEVHFSKQDERKYLLDRRYQLKALNQMFSCNPSVPYLLLGPFGTGKTYLLAAAVAKVIETGGNQVRVLVCTHLNRGADGLYKGLQGKVKHVKRHVARVVSSSESSRLQNASVIYPNETVLNFAVLVTTFGVALSLVDFVESGGLTFTHILIDEGAQCPEPEVLGAIVLASRETRIIIVGDNKQVGPQVRVLSERARENGLGESLLERLFSHYKAIKHASMTETHTSSLLTNYRCHPSILMLASSLFYECTLLSQNKREAHPKAPYPLVFVCTSVRQDGFSNCSPENEEEAQLLITKMIEYIQTWHSTPTEPIGLLASTKQQVACLRKNWRQMKKHYNFHHQVEILNTYNIQGEEFSAVFLSTSEPTDGHGAPADHFRSICNEYVFNTVVTRAQSLVFVAGNPFFLLHMGSHFKTNCWTEYIRRCIQCQSFELPRNYAPSDAQNLPKIIGQICEKVFLSENIQQAKAESFDTNEVDIIVERYLSDLNERREYKIATQLVQSPSGDISWVEQKSAQECEDGIVWCQLECKGFRKAVARPINPNDAVRHAISRRKGAMHGGMVKVDIIRKCVLFDEDTEQALASTHFGVSYLCRVDPKNPILFFPLDQRYPKFVNLPVLSVRAKNGVVCFDPKSINGSAKVNNFIPLEVATKMLFMVKFLGWQRKRSYPLGIIVAALPPGHSPYTGELLLRISNNIPLASCIDQQPHVSALEDTHTHAFTGAFTIDPEGSPDHDDALTCRLVSKTDKSNVYEIGVHIINVQKYIPKDSDLDKKACQRGCAAYRSPDHCISCMLPEKMIQNDLSISEGSTRHTLSVIVQYSVDNEGTIEETRNSITFIESKVQSNLALTYEEAQKLLFKESKFSSDPLFSDYGKVAQYNSQSLSSNKLRIEYQLSVLWKIALYIRQRRIGKDAAYSLIIEDSDDQRCPEAHILIQELMIWTNKHVAIKLLNDFPEKTVLRIQKKPSEEEFINLRKQHGAAMAISLALRSYVDVGETPVDQFHVLSSIYTKIREHIDKGQIRDVLHHLQFEHLHPQIAVAIVGLRQSRRSCGADYVVSTADEKEYWHDTLQCAQYTHFTSPIRRYIDIAVQRLLHAAIHNKTCPYTRKELQQICWQTKEAVKRSNNYDREVKRLDLVIQLRNIGQQHVSLVQQITEDAEVELTFTDPLLRVLYQRERSIALKHLNALSIPTQEREQSGPVMNSSPVQCSHNCKQELYANDPVIWQAKVSSFQGTARSFISNPMLQLIKNSSQFDSDCNRYAEISLLSLENGIVSESSNLIANKMIAKILPLTQVVPGSKWAQLQQIIKDDVFDNDPDYVTNTITKVFSSANDNPSNVMTYPALMNSPSPMWIYKLHRPIHVSEVLKVQLTSSCLEYVPSPTLQLVEVGPELRICVQHNCNPCECFADKLVKDASKRNYKSMEEYFRCWEQVLLYEAVIESLTESELLFIRDISLKWPKLENECDSLGQVSYKLVIPARQRKAGVVMEIPKEFMTISHDFFTFTVGDLLCVRYYIEKNGETVGFVLHMIIHHIDTDPKITKRNDRPEKVNVYLKFVGNTSNFISPQVAELLASSDTKCEVQLLPLTLPFRRIYRCLQNLRLDEDTSPLALQIAKGSARMKNTANLQNIDTMMTAEEASVSTAIWPITRREVGSGRKKLNRWQKEAIKIACNNYFTLIQGPPGTGKSVTGAHLAYAFAKKFCKEQSSLKSSQSSQKVKVEELKPCVMYCGPSNQAVNVVLNYLIQEGVPPVKDELKILRVFSKTIEQKEYPGPKLHDVVFPKFTTSETKCEPKHEHYALHKKIRQINSEIAAMDREFEELNRQNKIPSIAMRRKYQSMVYNAELKVLKSGFDIILCTCNEASSHRITKSVRPVYCIVDECAMCTEPECMVPIQRAEHVVLIGDHNQLRPVIKSREADAKGLGMSLFERYAQGDKSQQLDPLQKPYMLKMQYRMHEELCRFPSKEFYGGNLETDNSVRKRNNPEVHLRFWPHGPRKPFVFVHVEGIESESHTGRKGKARVGLESKYNKQEAEKIAEVAVILVNQYCVKQTSITALTPYSSQKEEIKKRLQNKKLPHIPVKTITESQGSESGIVLLSTVRSKPKDEISTQDSSSERKNADIGWIRRNLGFVTDRHQICVGLTRCKYGLLIVGNKHLLSYDVTWRRLIEHYMHNGCIKDGDSFPDKH